MVVPSRPARSFSVSDAVFGVSDENSARAGQAQTGRGHEFALDLVHTTPEGVDLRGPRGLLDCNAEKVDDVWVVCPAKDWLAGRPEIEAAAAECRAAA